MKYDGILFGNGMTLNLLSQLKSQTIKQKRYLLDIDDFLKSYISNSISPREEERIFSLFYDQKCPKNIMYFNKIKKEIANYYMVHNSNIEYWLGKDLFMASHCGYNFSLIKTIFPGLYNIWHEIMFDYLFYSGQQPYIKNFSHSVKHVLDTDLYVFTTNFDRLLNDLCPQHLHGSFVSRYKKYREICFSFINEEEFYFKCLWGWNGIGKQEYIKNLKTIREHGDYFDFDFFFDENICVKNLLIYGMGFQISGYMSNLAQVNLKYKNPIHGGIIDDHILQRLRVMQSSRQLSNITFAYYSDKDKHHYEQLAALFNLRNVDYIPSQLFDFHI